MKVNKIADVWVIQYIGIPGKDVVVSEDKLFNLYNY